MKQALDLRQTQRLTLTPRLKQSIYLLQLSSLDLQREIGLAIESNPLLEAPDHTSIEEPLDNEREPPDLPAGGLDFDANEAVGESSSYDNFDDYDARGHFTETCSDDWHPGPDYDSRNSALPSLRGQLLRQAGLAPMSGRDRRIAEVLIDCIGDHGYLETDLDEVRAMLAAPEPVARDEVEMVLHQIQNFEPTGVGARNLRECLALQLHRIAPATPGLALARRLLDHLALIGKRDFAALKRALGVDVETLRRGIELIQQLNPRPGESTSGDPALWMIPDVLVTRRHGGWRVELNPAVDPGLRIDCGYRSMLEHHRSDATGQYLKDQLRNARWFIHSVHNRYDTILKVARIIVTRQQAFFELGATAMQPLIMREVAEATGLHESTVSRATNQKYMHSPRGTLELKYFFSGRVDTTDRSSTSATAIQQRIREIIGHEPPGKPHSDQQLVELLDKEGCRLARRTVAKYRETMGIAPSNRRKTLT